MRTKYYAVLAMAAFIGLAAPAGGALAADPYVPETGQAGGIVIPHALPGESTHRHSASEGHLIAPTGLAPETGQAQGVTPPNSVPGARAQIGEAQPHADVLSPPGTLPDRGQERGPTL